MITGNCILTAKVKPEHYTIFLYCQNPTRTLLVLQTSFNPEMIYLHTNILLVIKPMRSQFKFTHRLIGTSKCIYTLEYIYTHVLLRMRIGLKTQRCETSFRFKTRIESLSRLNENFCKNDFLHAILLLPFGR